MRENWTFLSNHGHVLVCLAGDPDVRLKDVASCIGITERAVQQIVADLEGSGIISRHRVGRRNHYEVESGVALRHAAEHGVRVGTLLEPLLAVRALPECPFLSRCTLARTERDAQRAAGHRALVPLSPPPLPL